MHRISTSLLATTLLAAFVFTAPALAQSDNPYNGKWKINFDSKNGTDLEGAISIDGAKGTWDMATRARRNPCIGMAYPITVQKATADELTFTVNRAVTLVGCTDSTYTFKKVDDKTLKGEVDEGRAAVMTKK